MSIVITQGLVLSSPQLDSSLINAPIIGWRNLIALGSIVADYENPFFPVSNLTNPSTAELWRSTSSADQYLTTSLDEISVVDYVALARHNLGSSLIPVLVETRISEEEAWVPATGEFILPNNDPTIVRFEPREATQVRVRLGAGMSPPEIAVLYLGELLKLQRNIYVGHTPINYGRRTRVTNGMSESGQFLGRIVLGQSKTTSISLQNLTPQWYRQKMDPFVIQAIQTPFFFAWRPDGYPKEVGYAWITADVIPVNQRPNGMMQVELQIGAIAGDVRDLIVVPEV